MDAMLSGWSVRVAAGLLAGVSLAGCASSEHAQIAIGGVLDEFHAAASRADEDVYFSLLTDDAVFLGTDPGERWTKDEFEAWAMPYFQRASAWTYVPLERHITIEPGSRAAWFDEVVRNTSYGDLRGSGVLRRTGEGWRIAQYNLSFVVPNAIAGEVVEMIRSATMP